MGIRFFCPNGHKLNVKEFQAGRRGSAHFAGQGSRSLCTAPGPARSRPAALRIAGGDANRGA